MDDLSFLFKYFVEIVNNAKNNAGVVCIIIGLGKKNNKSKIFYNNYGSKVYKNISPYLIDAKNFEDVITFGKSIGKLMVITRGEKGSIAISGDEVVEFGIFKNLNIVDLTGAGDLFAAGFLHGQINNLSIKESLQKGTEMSSKIIQKIGARLF